MAAAVCVVLAVVLTVLPGPAFVFWILACVLLGVSVGEVLLSVHAFQDWARRRIPLVDRLPALRRGHIRSILRHRWVRMLERHSERRERRRAARARRQAGAVEHTRPASG